MKGEGKKVTYLEFHADTLKGQLRDEWEGRRTWEETLDVLVLAFLDQMLQRGMQGVVVLLYEFTL